ncbi:DUF5789 family protein [Halovivax gelatinilyticus]|uniref:DUF5789 family protein n=1 Tax=Halovivax gelatinilyticus TaxID=2961597 RepID=UPI0020CA8A05|nr:DUF2795 domain-containing protein [Halovivax gelatinilyticus]
MHLSATTSFTESLDYPATTAELISSCGEQPIELPNGTETVGDVLERVSQETYETPDELALILQSALSRKAIGRFGYSDRDPSPPGSVYKPPELSF